MSFKGQTLGKEEFSLDLLGRIIKEKMLTHLVGMKLDPSRSILAIFVEDKGKSFGNLKRRNWKGGFYAF